ncbi:hypothetical protein BU23DRAFT_562013 [Bimuria novae-zelandiae CBS 107.79]|uniref:Uncharacterized protein n=1 Tax=Bimuria novae-zelandiae CBS 107.79 TaxID=1447943 RepID=A0A6A5UN37_9PLEO|nr:hypothetical protein BU23DRAFT_562013 [Bimuria novae-zelandiae CBS 107.79]
MQMARPLLIALPYGATGSLSPEGARRLDKGGCMNPERAGSCLRRGYIEHGVLGSLSLLRPALKAL